MDRKYRQHGYQDEDREKRPEKSGRPPGQRDMLGPRTPQFPARVTVARCAGCGALLPKDVDTNGQCPRCNFDLHCCKQCVHFDTSTRWECTQTIPARIARKDARNECAFYEMRMSSERETTSGRPAPAAGQPAASRSDGPRQAFENLFKK
jgi:hypothetical protein